MRNERREMKSLLHSPARRCSIEISNPRLVVRSISSSRHVRSVGGAVGVEAFVTRARAALLKDGGSLICFVTA